jgi:hypothetical protein
MTLTEVAISQRGRCGSISYRESDNEIVFDWEFGGSAVALVWGTKMKDWIICHTWAANRQQEIYTFVANEVIRQKAPTSNFEIDLASGTITIL